jgi:beta-galactosidase
MKKCYSLVATLFLFPVAFLCGAQPREEFAGVFAPHEGWVKPSEQPYRRSLCLNGLWQFQSVALPAKFREGVDSAPELPRPTEQWDRVPIRIPSPWNANTYSYTCGMGSDFRCFPSYPKAWETTKMGWLRKSFTVPVDWSGTRIQLHFSAVAGDAEIIVNGKPVGHKFGVFLPFDVDITDAVILGRENTLSVGIRQPSLFDVKGPVGKRQYQGGSMWGWHIAGIWDDVHLVRVPAVRVSDTFVKPLLDQDKLEVEFTLRNDGDKEAEVSVGGRVYPWISKAGPDVLTAPLPSSELGSEAVLELAPGKARVPAHGEARLVMGARVNGRLKTWSPEAPNLYGLVAHASVAGRTVDGKYTRFGWRQFSMKGNQYLLNGKRLVLKGDSWHHMGIPQMTRRYAWAWYKAVRDANLNTVRLHANPYPTFYLDMADEMGVLILDETAIYASGAGLKFDSDLFWKDTLTHIQEFVLRDRNHPSVLGWSVSNEVLPVITDRFNSPPAIMAKLAEYYVKWVEICRRLDPTRPWISADGEKDGLGKLPTYICHYEGPLGMRKAQKSGKPWGVGEAGYAYYGSPEELAAINGNRAYESCLGRMEGVAIEAYELLSAQREFEATFRSVFNMIWYGMKPLALGMKDTSHPPTLDDGIYFTSFHEGHPGVQPERLGPYCTTLNPGYTSAFPLYEPWPLFDAIRDACAEPPCGSNRWSRSKPTAVDTSANKPVPSISSARIVAGAGSTLAKELEQAGVPLGKLQEAAVGKVPQVLFVDGANPPGPDAVRTIQEVLDNKGTVAIWGVGTGKVDSLNALLPLPLEVTARSASSLLCVGQSPLTVGLSAADMYYSELVPPEVVTAGLAGPLVDQSTVLLKACDTDWLLWNKYWELDKPVMIFRSEQERKPSGVALVSRKMGEGTLLVTTLPAAPPLAAQEHLVRTLLGNLGIPLGSGRDSGRALGKTGELTQVLLCASFPSASLQEGAVKTLVEPAQGRAIEANAKVGDKPWRVMPLKNDQLDLVRVPFTGPKQDAIAYISFWVFSPQDLTDFLIRPGLPRVDLELAADDALQVWLNGREVLKNLRMGPIAEGKATASGLPLQQGWNHILVKLIQTSGGWHWKFTGRLTCNKPEFLSKLDSALQRP